MDSGRLSDACLNAKGKPIRERFQGIGPEPHDQIRRQAPLEGAGGGQGTWEQGRPQTSVKDSSTGLYCGIVLSLGGGGI
jgi:hypothetical protein